MFYGTCAYWEELKGLEKIANGFGGIEKVLSNRLLLMETEREINKECTVQRNITEVKRDLERVREINTAGRCIHD